MDAIGKLAEEFKLRDNQKILSPQIGKVITTNPLKISIQNGKIIVQDDNILLCSMLSEKIIRKSNIKLDKKIIKGRIKINDIWQSCEYEIPATEWDVNNHIELKEILKVNDLVAMVPIGKKFLVIDRVI